MRTETLELHLKNLRSLRRFVLEEAEKLRAESTREFIMRDLVTNINHVSRRLKLVLYLQKRCEKDGSE